MLFTETARLWDTFAGVYGRLHVQEAHMDIGMTSCHSIAEAL